jgi:hypothetical protein
MMIRPGACLKTCSKPASMTPQKGSSRAVALVESAAAPARRAARTRPLGVVARPVVHRRMVKFVITLVHHQPDRVVMPSPTPSGMEWHTWKNSTLKGPIWTYRRPARCADRPVQVARLLINFQNAAVSGSRKSALDLIQYVADCAGRSSCPCVMMKPRTYRAVEEIREIRNNIVHPQHIAVGNIIPGPR